MIISELHHAVIFADAIMKSPLPGETTTDRLRQLGLLSIISMMHEKDEVVTPKTLLDYTEGPASAISSAIRALIGRGLIVETVAADSEANPRSLFASQLQASLDNAFAGITIQ